MRWNRRRFVRSAVAVLALRQPALARAQTRLEIITLRHRPAEQILPALRPLVEQGGGISMLGDKILLRVSPANLAELQAVIASLDTPLCRLRVSVRQDDERRGESAGVGLSGRFSPGNSAIVVQGGADGTRRSDSLSQQVDVVEGGRALIRIGQSLPLMLREWHPAAGGGWVQVDSLRYVDLGSGFYAAPQLLGDRVQVDISPSMERVEAGGSVSSARLSTTVSGPIGAWIALGDSRSQSELSGYGSSGAGRGQGSSVARVWLRVDVLE